MVSTATMGTRRAWQMVTMDMHLALWHPALRPSFLMQWLLITLITSCHPSRQRRCTKVTQLTWTSSTSHCWRHGAQRPTWASTRRKAKRRRKESEGEWVQYKVSIGSIAILIPETAVKTAVNVSGNEIGRQLAGWLQWLWEQGFVTYRQLKQLYMHLRYCLRFKTETLRPFLFPPVSDDFYIDAPFKSSQAFSHGTAYPWVNTKIQKVRLSMRVAKV